MLPAVQHTLQIVAGLTAQPQQIFCFVCNTFSFLFSYVNLLLVKLRGVSRWVHKKKMMLTVCLVVRNRLALFL